MWGRESRWKFQVCQILNWSKHYLKYHFPKRNYKSVQIILLDITCLSMYTWSYSRRMFLTVAQLRCNLYTHICETVDVSEKKNPTHFHSHVTNVIKMKSSKTLQLDAHHNVDHSSFNVFKRLKLCFKNILWGKKKELNFIPHVKTESCGILIIASRRDK